MLRQPPSLGFDRKEIQSDILVEKMHIWIHLGKQKYKSKSTAMLQGLNIKYVLEENIRDTKRRQIFTKYRVCETPFSCTKKHTDKHDFHEKKKSVVYARSALSN